MKSFYKTIYNLIKIALADDFDRKKHEKEVGIVEVNLSEKYRKYIKLIKDLKEDQRIKVINKDQLCEHIASILKEIIHSESIINNNIPSEELFRINIFLKVYFLNFYKTIFDKIKDNQYFLDSINLNPINLEYLSNLKDSSEPIVLENLDNNEIFKPILNKYKLGPQEFVKNKTSKELYLVLLNILKKGIELGEISIWDNKNNRKFITQIRLIIKYLINDEDKLKEVLYLLKTENPEAYDDIIKLCDFIKPYINENSDNQEVIQGNDLIEENEKTNKDEEKFVFLPNITKTTFLKAEEQCISNLQRVPPRYNNSFMLIGNYLRQIYSKDKDNSILIGNARKIIEDLIGFEIQLSSDANKKLSTFVYPRKYIYDNPVLIKYLDLLFIRYPNYMKELIDGIIREDFKLYIKYNFLKFSSLNFPSSDPKKQRSITVNETIHKIPTYREVLKMGSLKDEFYFENNSELNKLKDLHTQVFFIKPLTEKDRTNIDSKAFSELNSIFLESNPNFFEHKKKLLDILLKWNEPPKETVEEKITSNLLYIQEDSSYLDTLQKYYNIVKKQSKINNPYEVIIDDDAEKYVLDNTINLNSNRNWYSELGRFDEKNKESQYKSLYWDILQNLKPANIPKVKSLRLNAMGLFQKYKKGIIKDEQQLYDQLKSIGYIKETDDKTINFALFIFLRYKTTDDLSKKDVYDILIKIRYLKHLQDENQIAILNENYITRDNFNSLLDELKLGKLNESKLHSILKDKGYFANSDLSYKNECFSLFEEYKDDKLDRFVYPEIDLDKRLSSGIISGKGLLVSEILEPYKLFKKELKRIKDSGANFSDSFFIFNKSLEISRGKKGFNSLIELLKIEDKELYEYYKMLISEKRNHFDSAKYRNAMLFINKPLLDNVGKYVEEAKNAFSYINEQNKLKDLCEIINKCVLEEYPELEYIRYSHDLKKLLDFLFKFFSSEFKNQFYDFIKNNYDRKYYAIIKAIESEEEDDFKLQETFESENRPTKEETNNRNKVQQSMENGDVSAFIEIFNKDLNQNKELLLGILRYIFDAPIYISKNSYLQYTIIQIFKDYIFDENELEFYDIDQFIIKLLNKERENLEKLKESKNLQYQQMLQLYNIIINGEYDALYSIVNSEGKYKFLFFLDLIYDRYPNETWEDVKERKNKLLNKLYSDNVLQEFIGKTYLKNSDMFNSIDPDGGNVSGELMYLLSTIIDDYRKKLEKVEEENPEHTVYPF